VPWVWCWDDLHARRLKTRREA